MYNLVTEKKDKTSFDLMEDINLILIKAGYTINKYDDIFGASSLRGKEIFFSKGSSHFSISCTHYSNMSPTDTSELILPTDTINVIGCGSLSVSCNTGYDLNLPYHEQPTNTGTSGNQSSVACIPKNNNFDYKIYKTIDNFNFLIRIRFDDLNFYVLFGDSSNNGTLQTEANSYVFGSVRNYGTNKKCGYPVDLNERLDRISNYELPQHFLLNEDSLLGELWGNIIYSISSVLVPYTIIEKKTGCSVGKNEANISNNSILENLNEQFTGVNVMIPYELFLPTNTVDTSPPLKRVKEFDFGVFSDEEMNDGEIRRINNNYYEFMYLMKRINKDRDTSNFKQQQNYNLGIWILRGDIT